MLKTRNTAWTIDPLHSGAAFSIRHMVVGKVRGLIPVSSGAIEVTDNGLATVNALIDLVALTTGREARDAHLKSVDFFDAENHPTASFHAEFHIPENPEELTEITGTLNIKGTAHAVDLAVIELEMGENMEGVKMLSFEATTLLDRTDFGLTFDLPLPSGLKAISNKVALQIQIEASLSNSAEQ